jgi:hypothetical protein
MGGFFISRGGGADLGRWVRIGYRDQRLATLDAARLIRTEQVFINSKKRAVD